MKIKINELMGHSKIEFDFTADSIDGIDLKGDVHVTGIAYNNGTQYIVTGEYKTTVTTQCVKCLENILETMEGSFEGKFLDSKSYKEYLKSLASDSELGEESLDEAVNGEIDILELVRQYIILDLPLYPACVPMCKDASALEKYSDDGIDPRWQQLLQIKN
ncbi:MAG: DUF177 domain-containing protein [Cetobacterium sp.]|uniref:YceD family protein n=1 Tax=unclassified Cetobacterium TaxID=2630983 RepID=UPI002101DF43|nr:DUF177 domain-containing protein [Cetobacterium sp. 2A]